MKDAIRKVERATRDKRLREIERRADFRSFLKRLDHAKRCEFFSLVLKQAPHLLPVWRHTESPFDLASSDERLVEWLAELAAMQTSP